MNVIKKILRYLCSYLFKFSITMLAISFALNSVIASPKILKDSLQKSGIFDNAVNNLIEQATQSQPEQQGEIPLNDPEIKAVINNAFGSEFLAQSSSSVIDGVFGWLQGATAEPVFTIDLSVPKQKLADGISDVVVSKASRLPNCTFKQLKTMDLNNLDIFNLQCIPPGLNLQTERAKIVDKIANGDEFIKDTTITYDDLPKNNNQDIFSKISYAPTLYQWILRMAAIFAGLSLLTGLGLVLLHDTRRRAYQILGRSVLFTGLSLGLIVVLSKLAQSKLSGSQMDDVQKSLSTLFVSVADKFNQNLIIFAVVYLLFGAISLLVLHYTKPNTSSSIKK